MQIGAARIGDARRAHSRNERASLATLAAAYGFGLARNHAFVDGHKRIAFIAIALFLRLKGMRLVAPDEDARPSSSGWRPAS